MTSFNIPNFHNSESFFQSIYSSNGVTPENSSEYIKWECTPSKESLCEDILSNFQRLKERLLLESDQEITTRMIYFEKREEKTRKGRIVKRLKTIFHQANLSFVLTFLEAMFPEIVDHQNLLKNFRTNIDDVLNSLEDIHEIWLDFWEHYIASE